MSAIMVEKLQELADAGPHLGLGLGYFYCSYRDQQQHQSATVILANLLRQLVEQCEIPMALRNVYEQRDKKGPLTMSESLDIYCQVASNFERLYVVIDALDEYHLCDLGEIKTLMELLFGLQSSTQLNIVATSRDISGIGSLFQGCRKIEIRANNDDVQVYVSGRISELISGRLKEDADLSALVEKSVIESTQGM